MISGSEYVARVFRDGQLEGGGLPVAPDLVLTCAHVVGSEAAAITIDLPASSGARTYAATVAGWKAPQSAEIGNAAEDLCVLRLKEALPEFEFPPLVVACDLLGDAWRVVGFPDLYDEGVEASQGTVGLRLPSGRIQLDSQTVTGHAIAPGFSGAPVWDAQLRAFAGIIAESDMEPGSKTATMVPLDAFVESFDIVANAVSAGLRDRWRRWEEAQRSNIALQAALSDPALHVTPSISDLWADFSRETPWHEQVRDEIETLLERANGLELPRQLTNTLATLDSIDCSRSYPEVLNSLRRSLPKTLVGEIRAMLRKEEDQQRERHNPPTGSPRWLQLHDMQRAAFSLGRLAATPRFARCFLVAGRFGSGKTHFLASLLNASPYELHLPVSVSGDDIGRDILAAAREASGIEWKSLADLDAMLSLLSAEGETGIDLFAHFDDLHTAIRRTPSLLPNIARFVDAQTSLHSLRYVMTIQDAQYDRVATQSDFWVRHTAVGMHAGEDEKPIPISHAGGWMILDDRNELHQTGQAILRQGLADTFPHEQELEYGKRLLAHPLTAVILVSLGGQARGVSLHFPEFVADFWRRRKATLDPAPLTLAELEEAVAILARLIADLGEMPFVRDLLQRAASVVLSGVPWSAERFAPALEVIETASLIRVELAVPDDPASRRLFLLFDAFWSHRLAVALMRELNGLDRAKTINRAIRSALEKPDLASLAEGTLEFLIFLLARDDAERGQQRTQSVVRAAFAGQGLSPAAPWLAGAHLAPKRQKQFLDDGLSSIMPSTALRPLFAFLYFLRNAELAPRERLEASSRAFDAVATHKLETYYLYFFETVLERFTSASDLAGALLALEGVEAIDITADLASVAAMRLASLAGRDLLDVLITHYLRPMSMRGPAPRLKDQAWRRHFFREWLLHFILTDLTDEHNIALYDMLVRQNWYDAAKIGIRFPISRDMEREANIAIGARYRRPMHQQARRDYQDRLRAMIESDDMRDRVAAFFIIRHTEPPGDTDRVFVKHEFQSMLERLSHDTQLVGRVVSFAGLFTANVDGFVPPPITRRSRRPA